MTPAIIEALRFSPASMNAEKSIILYNRGMRVAEPLRVDTGTDSANHGERWFPILSDPALAGRVSSALDDLAEALAQPAPASFEPRSRWPADLADGPAGVALFFHYLDQAQPGKGYDGHALAHLETAIESTAEMVSSPAL